MASVDNGPWDGNAAMGMCSSAADYRAICAGHTDGDPSLRSTWKLPHHTSPGAPPNAAGVRNALSRLPQTQGLTNRAAAQAHLESHMNAINPESNTHGGAEVRTFVFSEWEVRHSGRADEAFTVRGYPAVYNSLSHDLGGFREKIDPGAFDAVLAGSPHVVFTWDHDTRFTGASTSNGTLELRSDAVGLYMDARVGNYSWAKDLRTALERGDISQGSFKFTVGDGGDTWDVAEDGSVTRTLNPNGVSGLYDVTITAQGAYPQTSLAAARSLAAVTGRLSPTGVETGAERVAPEEEGEQESHQGSVNPERVRRIEDLRARYTLRRNELAELAERLGRL